MKKGDRFGYSDASPAGSKQAGHRQEPGGNRNKVKKYLDDPGLAFIKPPVRNAAAGLIHTSVISRPGC